VLTTVNLAGQRALQGDLQEAVLAIRGQVRAAVVENAQHSARTEEALVRASERQRNVDAAHELALQALAKQLGAQVRLLLALYHLAFTRYCHDQHCMSRP